ncbi:modular serine protease-like [Hyposmocoma kahamanoa]|uniref:modular serine protease-like n=1 Tax=Hyposmocoma kahamanoa TaxID=1477025 RepID=UPI000E6D88B0|nr:modular serine protease-like [Hyposmocoma kahamanoa]
MYPDVVIFLCLFSTPVLTATLEQSRSLCRNNQWQCSNGDCVPLEAKCDGTLDCADESDESETFASCHRKTKPVSGRNCVVPPYPDNGRYIFWSVPNASPGQLYFSLLLNVSCNLGYDVIGKNFAFCVGGMWSMAPPKCVRACGTTTPSGDLLRTDGHGRDWPWHASIYKKTTTPYMQLGEGTLISTTVVISAAHCFWTDVGKLQPAENYAVAVGNLYRRWDDPRDVGAQKSDIKDIKIPVRFQGAITHYQEDIAILRMTQAFEYKIYVRPVCLDFDVNFDNTQLQSGKLGKVATWNVPGLNINKPPALKVVELFYMDITECLANVPPGFREYITSDKICAGYSNGTGPALCKGDSGGGLVFPNIESGVERFYLRGIMSVAPINENNGCSTLSGFTQILKHEHFIREHALDII